MLNRAWRQVAAAVADIAALVAFLHTEFDPDGTMSRFGA